MLRLALITLLASTAIANAADVALVLNDQEQAALREVLDAATRGAGLQVAGKTVYLLQKLNAAPVVTAHTDATPATPPPKE